MSHPHKPRAFWRLARLWFRRFRVTCWLLLLLLLVTLIYLHQVGVPGPFRRAVVKSFAAEGVSLEFSRLRLSWYKGVLAEQVRIRPSTDAPAPELECERVDLNLSFRRLLLLELQPESVALTSGRLRLPYVTTNGVTSSLVVSNIQGTLRFEHGGDWHLDGLEGRLATLSVSASGSLTNAASLGDWRIFQARATTNRAALPTTWRKVSDILENTTFARPPELTLVFNVDGAAPDKSSLRCVLDAAAARSPHATWTHARLAFSMVPAGADDCSLVEMDLEAGSVQTAQGRLDNLQLFAGLECQPVSGRLRGGRFDLGVERVATASVDADQVALTSELSFGGEGLTPTNTHVDLRAASLTLRHALAFADTSGVAAAATNRTLRFKNARLSGRITPEPASGLVMDHVPVPALQQLDRVRINATLETDELQETTFGGTNLALRLDWLAPRLDIRRLEVGLPGGTLEVSAGIDASTGHAEFNGVSTIDPKGLSGVLPPVANEWLDRYTWQAPPRFAGGGSVEFPRWTPDSTGWPGDIRPSLVIDARFEAGPATFRGMPVQGASSAVHYSNMFWNLPDLTVQQPDGRVFIEHVNNDRTADYLFRIQLNADPTPAWALISPTAVGVHRTLGELHFSAPPAADLFVTGCWRDDSRLHVDARVRATQVTFRGVSADELRVVARFTNSVLTLTDAFVRQGARTAATDRLEFRFTDRVALLSNATTTLPPMDIATVIGPEVVRVMEPYRFISPPEGSVEGVIPLGNIGAADLRFRLKGGPFEWWKFKLPQIEGLVHWKGETVTITNLESIFYGGAARGGLFLDFAGKPSPDFTFHTEVFGADMQPLVSGLFDSTNRLEGRLSGSLVVTQANAGDFGSWFGHGTAELKDGLIWNIPVFGVVSPVLEAVVPGMGNSRASAATGTFIITNSVIRTGDLVIHSSNMRLRYEGTVDYQGKVNATAEADLLRDAFMIGQAVSLFFTPVSKLMIMEITGTLAEPNARPYYVLPRVLLAPLNPVKLFKDFFVTDTPATNAPPPEPGPNTGGRP